MALVASNPSVEPSDGVRYTSSDDGRYYVLTRIFQFLVRARMNVAGDTERLYVYLAILVASGVEARREGLAYDSSHWPTPRLSALSIAEMTGIPRQTVRRKLVALENTGMIASEPDGAFRLIYRPVELDIVSEIDGYFARLSPS
jgi:hypothetical protein